MTTLTGAAARFREVITRARGATNTTRQKQAYDYWDGGTPEVGFAGIWMGRGMSKARLFAGIRQPDGEIIEADDGHPATEFVSQIAGGPDGQSQMLEQFGPHLVVAGEAWVIVLPRTDADEWFVVSVNEIEQSRGRGPMKATVVVDGEEQEHVIPPAGDKPDPNAPMAIRIWNPHPKRYLMADSPVMRSTVILDELRLLNASVSAIAQSRLGGRGVFIIPQGSQLPDQADLFDRFIDVAEQAYKDPASAAAIVPILLEVPKESVEPKLIKFESAFDELALKLREEAIRRFATASDTPADVLLGNGDPNHWNLWFLRDEAIEIGIEPRLATVCTGLTQRALHPAMQAKNVRDWRDTLVWYDTASLRQRSNRSQTAIELGQNGVINDNAIRRETGFEDADAPSAFSRELTTVISLVSSTGIPTLLQQSPELAAKLASRIEGLLDRIGEENVNIEGEGAEVDLPVDETQAPPEQPEVEPEPEPEPQSEPTPVDALGAALDGLIVRALERAGNRVRASRPRSDWDKLVDVEASAYHTVIVPTTEEVASLKLLAGAWERVGELSERYCVDASCLEALLTSYVSELLVSGSPHTYDVVSGMIEEASCLQPV